MNINIVIHYLFLMWVKKVKDSKIYHDNLQVFGKSLFQAEYKIVKKRFEEHLPQDLNDIRLLTFRKVK